jgi:AraC-like DNA-binding protein
MGAPLEPWTNAIQLDESSTMTAHRYADRFSIVRVETTGPLADAVHKSSSVPALLVSTFVRSAAARDYRLWVDGKIVPTGPISAYRANVIDLDAEPAMWGGRGLHHVHFHLRRAAIDDTAETLGYSPVGDFRLSLLEHDVVLAQITKSVLPFLDPGSAGSPPLALDHLELILAAHVMQRYGAARQTRPVVRSGLAAWQRRQATEILRENLDGRVRLADLARTCDLSVSHFARSFKASFGTTCHRWLTQRRIERAQELLSRSELRLADIATLSGFVDQAAFTRTFHRFVGVTPGHWRRENGRLPNE